MRKALIVSSVVAALGAAACMPGAAPGMAPHARRPHGVEPSLDELARAEPKPDQRALLVVFPRSACSASARTVFLDESGAFVGALAPGEAALLAVPKRATVLVAVSSVEIVAPTGMWSLVDEVTVPPPPSGLVMASRRIDTRECASGQYADARAASREELEAILAEAPVEWLEPRADEGQAWLDAHGARVDELLGRRRKEPWMIASGARRR